VCDGDCKCCCCSGSGEGGGGIPLALIAAIAVLALVAFLGWRAYLLIVTFVDTVNGGLDLIADQIIINSPLIGLGVVVIGVSFLARKVSRKPVLPLAVRNQRPALPRQDNVILLPDLRSVPMQQPKARVFKFKGKD